MRPQPKTAVRGLLALACLLLQASPAIADDHGNDPSTATVISPGTVTAGAIDVGGDIDYFKFSVTTAGWYCITTRGTTDTYGELQDSALTALGTDNNSGEDNNFLLVKQLSPGTYYIRVTGYYSTTTGSYQLHVEGPGAGTVSDDHGL